ncbi:MAG TPA: hypothetical protein VFN10_23320 [Thermoanaerobaculia bacterium]|nr:hypothetical protein [Thermoanaerobaculia bacterium]
MIRRHRFGLSLIALLASSIFARPLLRGEIFTFRDHYDYFAPLRWFTAQELRAGRLPLWNPFSASGEPWLANPQTGVFYPPAWLHVVLPFATAYMLYLFAHLVLLGVGAYLLFSRRASEGAALAGAVALMFAGPTLSLLDVSNNLATFAWLPLVVWCALEGRAVWGGVALAMAFLAGEPFYAACAAAMYCCCVVATRVSVLRRIAIGAAIAFGLCAVQLFPFLEMLRGSDRTAGLSAAELFRDSMPLREWLRVAMPFRTLDPHAAQTFVPIVYCGALVILAVFIAWIAAPKRTFGWTALLVVAIVIGTGPSWLARLPLALFRYPARLVPLGAFALVALAVIGWDRIAPKARWVHLVVVMVLVADLVPRALPLLASSPFTPATPYARAIGRDAKVLRVGQPSRWFRRGWMAGYLNLYERRFDEFTAAPVVSERILRLHEELLAHPTRELLAMVPAGYILTNRDFRAAFPPLARGADVTLYRNENVWPMATLWSDANDARAMLAQRPLHTAPRAATIVEMTTSHTRVVVDTAMPSVLVLAQQNAAGWSASLDGRKVENFEKTAVFRAVSIPAGHHEVVWTYDPRSFLFGAMMTVVTLLSVAIGVIVKRRRERIFLFVSHEKRGVEFRLSKPVHEVESNEHRRSLECHHP